MQNTRTDCDTILDMLFFAAEYEAGCPAPRDRYVRARARALVAMEKMRVAENRIDLALADLEAAARDHADWGVVAEACLRNAGTASYWGQRG